MKYATRLLGGAVLYLMSVVGSAAPLNVILFIGDGMGPDQIKLGRMFANGDTVPFSFESFSHHALMGTNNASGQTTDSAASGTAMATGVKVDNGVISERIPGNDSELTTALENFKSRSKRTGLVVHATALTDATPAAFGAHTASRNDTSGIVSDFFTQTHPNVLFGETNGSITDVAAINAGYSIAHNNSELVALNSATTEFALGHWTAANAPSLATMTTKALDILDNDPDGFFLLVHDQDPDTGGHNNSRSIVKNGVLSIVSAVDAALAWAAGRTDTLMLVTADHETGGLTVLANNGQGVLPTVSWSTTGHTQTRVNVFAQGPNSELVAGSLDNTNIFTITTVPELSSLMLVGSAGAVFLVGISARSLRGRMAHFRRPNSANRLNLFWCRRRSCVGSAYEPIWSRSPVSSSTRETIQKSTVLETVLDLQQSAACSEL